MIEVLPQGVYMSESQVEDLRMPEYKSHLRRSCEFSQADLNTLFRLISTHPHILCKAYLIHIPRNPNDDWPQTRILKILSAATIYGPQSDRLKKFIERDNLCLNQPKM